MEDKNKKIMIAVLSLAVLALVVVTVWEPGQWSFRDPTDYDQQAKLAQEELEQYKALLASIEPNYAASQQFLEKIATEDLVRTEVATTLQTNQKITIPQVANNEINISNRNDRDFVINYLSDTSSMISNYREAVASGIDDLFATGGDSGELARAEAKTDELVNNWRGVSVPQSAVDLHKASLVALDQYGDVFKTAKDYATRENDQPWPTVYNKYAVIDSELAVVKTELEELNRTYAFGPDVELPKFSLVKTAQAQFGGWTIVGVDWQMILYEGIKTGLARAFAQFSIQMIDKLVGHIEKNFAIASQLYYSNELGRFYSVEYMKKFVKDPLDKDIISKFIPEYFCVNPDGRQLRDIFVAKARENVGSDLVINPADPDFLDKLARLGADEKNYPVWWEGYYQSLAATTKAEADKAATKEVISPGVKTGRDIVNSQVTKTISAILDVQESAINGTMNLGSNNAENIAGQLVAGIVQNLVNKFIFTPLAGGSTSGPSGIGIIAERDVCLATPQVKPVIPIAEGGYTPPSGSEPAQIPVPQPTPISPR